MVLIGITVTDNLNLSAPEHDSYVFSAQVTVSSTFLTGMRIYVLTLTPRILPSWGPSTAQILAVLCYICDVIKLLDTLQTKTGEFSKRKSFWFPLDCFLWAHASFSLVHMFTWYSSALCSTDLEKQTRNTVLLHQHDLLAEQRMCDQPGLQMYPRCMTRSFPYWTLIWIMAKWSVVTRCVLRQGRKAPLTQ